MMKTCHDKKIPMRNNILRLVLCALSILIQIAWIVLSFAILDEHYEWLALGMRILSIIVAMWIYGTHINTSGKVLWIVFIMVFPVLGILMYFITGLSGSSLAMKRRIRHIDTKIGNYLPDSSAIISTIKKKDISAANIMHYITEHAGYSVYKDSRLHYFADTKNALEEMKASMKKARHFIFMEYFAIEDKEAFSGIKEILEQKAKEGVTIRILYDEVGSVNFINRSFAKSMKEKGIQCRIFNPMTWVINTFLNNRDHRKLTVIDGDIAFTGGFNIADEYFNFIHPHGHWKDNGISVEGPAVKSFTAMFIQMWNSMLPKKKETLDKDIKSFMSLTDNSAKYKDSGYCVPYADSPMDEEHTGENVYMNIINAAQSYVYFITPYLIITDEMSRMLGLAAKRGVDVRIITPGIPDKKFVYQTTRSYYAMLVRRGVRIYEYTPGFCHAKTCIADDKMAVCGTINLDYRSLYHHFENGIFIYDNPCLKDIKTDFDRTLLRSREVTEKYRKENRILIVRIIQCLMRLISPLL